MGRLVPGVPFSQVTRMKPTHTHTHTDRGGKKGIQAIHRSTQNHSTGCDTFSRMKLSISTFSLSWYEEYLKQLLLFTLNRRMFNNCAT